MSEKAVEKTFQALFALSDLRQIFRVAKPTFELSTEQKEKVEEIIKKVRESLDTIEKEMIK